MGEDAIEIVAYYLKSSALWRGLTPLSLRKS